MENLEGERQGYCGYRPSRMWWKRCADLLVLLAMLVVAVLVFLYELQTIFA